MRRVVGCCLLLAACSFRHGTLMSQEDAPPVVDDDARLEDAPLVDARPIDGPPDATPDARVCPTAPTGCTAFTCGTASCYYVCSGTKRSWANANTACGAITQGANTACLATINNQGEQNCIVTATIPMFANNNYVWFGFRQDANATEPAGNWAWECGSSTYTAPNWGIGEPNNTGGNEDCAALTDGGGWFDATCSGQARYVCELL